MSFKFRSLAVAIAAISSAVAANAAGLDRSTQPSWAFTQDGTFAYVEHVTIDPNVSGKDNALVANTTYQAGRDVPNMADDYSFLNFGAKADVNDRVSVGAFFDQPWGADVKFEGNNNFVAQSADATIQQLTPLTDFATANATLTSLQNGIAVIRSRLADPTLDAATRAALMTRLMGDGTPANPGLVNQATALAPAVAIAAENQNNLGEGTNVNISSQNFTGLLGVKLGENKNFQIYGGPVLQKLEGEVHLRGIAYQGASGYDLNIPTTTGYGWMAGVAYSKPEIALKAALTYRSEVEHDIPFGESMPLAALRGLDPVQTNKVTINTPKSVNLDFQTGINPTTLLSAKLRWVPWSDFGIKPKLYNTAAIASGSGDLNLVSYDDDAWTAELGLGKKLSDKWAVSGAVGWDSGAGNPVTSLGPVEGNWNVGLGAKYNLTPEWAVSGGVKYLMFGDAKAKIPTGALVGDFQDNDGMVYGLRLSYQKK